MGFYGYNYYDIAGYVEGECDVVCPNCVTDQDKATPIICGSEWDYQPICDTCGCELDGITILGDDDASA